MSKVLTREYLKAHMTDNDEHYLEAGKILSNEIFEQALAYVDKNGESEKISLSIEVTLEPNVPEGCVTVTTSQGISYHRNA